MEERAKDHESADADERATVSKEPQDERASHIRRETQGR